MVCSPGSDASQKNLQDALRRALDDRDKFKGWWENVDIVCDKQHARIAALEPERDRLRPIAEEMAAQDCESYCGAEYNDGHECWPSIARAALEGK